MFNDIRDDHLGFHLECGGRKGLFYGRMTKSQTIECDEIIYNAKISPFILIKNGTMEKIPSVSYEIFGKRGITQVKDFAKIISSSGIPLDGFWQRNLTNFLARSGNHILYEGPGYIIRENEERISRFKQQIQELMKGKDISEDEKILLAKEIDNQIETDKLKYSKFELITPDRTPMKFEENFIMKDLESVLEDLQELYDLTADKKAFIIAFSYSLFSPFAYFIRQKRYFFPNLIFLGLPETGKNSLLNLFLGSMWNNEDHILTTGDFVTEFATMVNMGGSGLPIVINDINQESFEKMRKYFMEGAMNPRSGSRGKANLELQEFESLRGFAISANFLNIGAEEATSRFIVHKMKEANSDNAERWNAVASRLRGGMYPIADAFIKWLNHFADPELFLGYFREKRLQVKRTIIEIGRNFLEDLLSIETEKFEYEEYEEDNLSIFVGWVQFAFRKMEKEQNWIDKDYYEHNAVTVRYDDTLYIRKQNRIDSDGRYTGDQFIVFPLAWKEFLNKYRDFPYKSMESFAKAYPGMLKCQPRKFREGDERKEYRVLIIDGMDNIVRESLANEKSLEVSD